MGTIYAIRALEEVSRVLYDANQEKVDNDTLLKYLNDTLTEMVIVNPAVNTVSESVQLATGITQSLPTDGIMLLNVPWNMGASGTTIGAPINRTTYDVINKRNPTWTTDTANGVVKAYIYDENNPSQFDVYPPQPATPQYVRLVYSKDPEKLDYYYEGIEIPIADYWFNALVNGMAYRCFREDSQYGNQLEKRNHHYQQFLGFLGVTAKEKPKEKGNG